MRNRDVPKWIGWLFIVIAFGMIIFTAVTGG